MEDGVLHHIKTTGSSGTNFWTRKSVQQEVFGRSQRWKWKDKRSWTGRSNQLRKRRDSNVRDVTRKG